MQHNLLLFPVGVTFPPVISLLIMSSCMGTPNIPSLFLVVTVFVFAITLCLGTNNR